MKVKNKCDLIDRLFQNRVFQNFILILGGVIICIILGRSIVNANTVWELADEAGYISNTAYFLGYDWDDVRATMPYYAYGYSIFLIPIYMFADTGVQLIQGAMCVNLFFAVGTYLIIIYILEKVGKQKNRMLTSTISFVTSLNSYLCCNVLKVNCESLSVFWYCLIALLLYKALESEKKYWFVLLGLAAAYLFFIHTRMFVLIFALVLTLLITFWMYNQKNDIVQLFLGGIVFLIFFIILYFIKQSIVDYAKGLNSTTDIVNGNLVNNQYILNRISQLFQAENLKFYALSFFSKIYYVVIASAGTIFFGYAYLLKDILLARLNKEDRQSYAVKLFFILGMTFMILVCTLNSAGSLENFCNFFYSRYYENSVIPIIAFSILGLITIKWNSKVYFYFLALEIGVGIIVSTLKRYLYSENIYIDTARIPGLSWLVEKNDSFHQMILWGSVIIVLMIGVYFISDKIKAKSIMVLLLIFFATWKSTSLGIEYIDNVYMRTKADTEIAEQILSDSSCEFVYMIDDETYKYSGYYSRMQVLIKDIPLKVIHKEELDQIDKIPTGTWILTYTDTVGRDTYLSELENIMSGRIFELWRK